MNTLQIIKNSIQKDSILNNIASFFPDEIYLVGGGIRDILQGKDLIDRDLIIVNRDAGDFAKETADFLGGKFIPLDEANKIYRIVLKDKINYLDITNPIENSLEKDILRRDLTINAICAEIHTGKVVDIAGGLKDFESKIIKGISEKNFEDDPLRILRIFRFHSLLGFEIDKKLTEIATEHAHLIANPAKERIEDELMKLFSGKSAHSALLKMDECSLLDKIFPFVKELKQVPPNSHHHLDLFHHSVETVRQVQNIYNSSSVEVREHLDKIDFGGFTRLAHLKLAAFMHDIGKFSTWTIEEETNRHRFIKHEDTGAKLCPTYLKELAFSNKQIDYIKTLIKNHIYPSMVVYAPDLNEKVMMRFVRKAGENAIDMITLAQADRLSARGVDITEDIVSENLRLLNKLQNFYITSLETLKPLPKLLDGNEIMKILEIPPSAQLGEILNELHEAQINGDILDKQQAINFVKSYKIG